MKFNLKNSIICSSLSLLLMACGGNEQPQEKEPAFIIDAAITDLSYETAYLNDYKDGEMLKLDSCKIVDGKFSFKGKMESTEARYINFNDGKERVLLFVENDSIHISGSLTDLPALKIIGSPAQDILNAFKQSLKTHEDKLNEIVDRYYAAEEAGQKEELEKIDAEYNATDSIKLKFIEDFVTTNKSSVVAPFIGLRYLAGFYEADQLEKLTNSFEKDAATSVYNKQLAERLAILKSTQVGVKAPEFSQNDENGNPIALSEFKGKYVLIDFWASWCGPCRAENPNVVAAFKKFNKKGFEVFGVSLDDNKEKWLEAIKKDGLTWKHVSDLKGWGNAVAKQYGVSSIPHSVLLDKEGVIIAKNLRGEELIKKLEEVVK